MYYIQIKFYFYDEAPKKYNDGPLLKDNRIVAFASKAEAINHLREYQITKRCRVAKYTSEKHNFRAGEYRAPEYQIRKFYQL